MKKSIIILCTLTIVLSISPSGYALFGIDNAVPQATYSVPMGQEIEKIAKMIQQLNYLKEQIDNMERAMKYDAYDSKLMSIMMGNEGAMEVLEDEDFFNGSSSQFNEWLANETYDMFDDTIDEFEDIDQETKERWEENSDKKVSAFMEEDTDPTYKELKNTAQREITENDNPENKNFKKETKKLYQKNQNIREDNKKELVESEKQDKFVEKQKEKLVDKVDNQSAEDFSLKSLNELMIQNNIISLELLSTMNEIKRQMIQLNSTIQREKINEDYKDIKREHHQ